LFASWALESLVHVDEIVAEVVDPHETPSEAQQADAATLLTIRLVVAHSVGIRSVAGPIVAALVSVILLLSVAAAVHLLIIDQILFEDIHIRVPPLFLAWRKAVMQQTKPRATVAYRAASTRQFYLPVVCQYAR